MEQDLRTSHSLERLVETGLLIPVEGEFPLEIFLEELDLYILPNRKDAHLSLYFQFVPKEEMESALKPYTEGVRKHLEILFSNIQNYVPKDFYQVAMEQVDESLGNPKSRFLKSITKSLSKGTLERRKSSEDNPRRFHIVFEFSIPKDFPIDSWEQREVPIEEVVDLLDRVGDEEELYMEYYLLRWPRWFDLSEKIKEIPKIREISELKKEKLYTMVETEVKTTKPLSEQGTPILAYPIPNKRLARKNLGELNIYDYPRLLEQIRLINSREDLSDLPSGIRSIFSPIIPISSVRGFKTEAEYRSYSLAVPFLFSLFDPSEPSKKNLQKAVDFLKKNLPHMKEVLRHVNNNKGRRLRFVREPKDKRNSISHDTSLLIPALMIYSEVQFPFHVFNKRQGFDISLSASFSLASYVLSERSLLRVQREGREFLKLDELPVPRFYGSSSEESGAKFAKEAPRWVEFVSGDIPFSKVPALRKNPNSRKIVRSIIEGFNTLATNWSPLLYHLRVLKTESKRIEDTKLCVKGKDFPILFVLHLEQLRKAGSEKRETILEIVNEAVKKWISSVPSLSFLREIVNQPNGILLPYGFLYFGDERKIRPLEEKKKEASYLWVVEDWFSILLGPYFSRKVIFSIKTTVDEE